MAWVGCPVALPLKTWCSRRRRGRMVNHMQIEPKGAIWHKIPHSLDHFVVAEKFKLSSEMAYPYERPVTLYTWVSLLPVCIHVYVCAHKSNMYTPSPQCTLGAHHLWPCIVECACVCGMYCLIVSLWVWEWVCVCMQQGVCLHVHVCSSMLTVLLKSVSLCLCRVEMLVSHACAHMYMLYCIHCGVCSYSTVS